LAAAVTSPTVALVIVLSGVRSQGRCPSPAPRSASGKTGISCACSRQADRAKEFYGRILGLPLVDDSPFALVFDAAGTELRVQKVAELNPAPYTALGWRVPDLGAACRDLSRCGVEPARFPGLPQDESGIWTSPDGHRVAWFRDPDGNTLSLTEDRGPGS
jgi:catechol 2,3-dioxygenase-like lactoylglutathione lyase family enzyme